jgi:cytochrome oxidase Cu insertion factor (SCO1/SenC/PrrC family)
VNLNSGLSPNDPTIEAAFRVALLHQGLIAAGILGLIWLVWGTSRNWVPVSSASRATLPEPRGRQVLRIGFGVLWLFDGILQAQPQMPAGLPTEVITPAAQGSPAWVQDLANWGGNAWSYHPIQAAAAVVWIQVGIGLWLLVAVRGRWSRIAGVASAVWGLSVWVFAEAFGSMFGPGASWLTGVPGAALVYAVAGVLIAMPPRAWRTLLPGRLLLGGAGLFFLGMAAMQAWPGNGFWQDGSTGRLASMVQSMVSTPQPHFLADLLRSFASFAAANGFAVNMVVVVVLAVLGAVFLTAALPTAPRAAAGPSRAAGLVAGVAGAVSARAYGVTRVAVIAGAVFCLAVWVLVQDCGFFGGVGTDPNSMIPTILLFAAGFAALRPALRPASAAESSSAAESVPAAESSAAAEPVPAAESAPAAGAEPQPAWQRAMGAVSFSSVTAFGALAIVVLGAAPMAAASTNRTADPIIAEAISGYSPPLQEPAPGIQLVNQNGKPASLSSLRGKVVLLTFLDPVCTTDCTFMGQEFLQAGKLLAADRSRVELVGVVVNPVYDSQAVVRAFDQQEGLSALPNWEFLTGTPTQLAAVWKDYGIAGEVMPAGAMIAHNDIAFVIDQSGQIREELSFDPGSGTSASMSSFGSLLASDTSQLLGAS